MLRPWQLNLNIEVENKNMPMYRALAAEVQRLIESGTLKPGDALPGSRDLARHLGISRKTVVSAMEQLVLSGWVENKERVGLFVKGGTDCNLHGSDQPDTALPVPGAEACKAKLVVDDGIPDTQLVPYAELSRAYRQFFNRAAKWKMLGYSDPRGSQAFRQAIAKAMCHGRSLCVSEEELLITRGSQQALYLTAHALLSPGDAVAIEWPTYQNALRAFESAGLEIVPVPVDAEGLHVDRLVEALEQHSNVRALYVTPRLQYPTTVTMSPVRRRQLAEVVTRHNLLVIEDDYDCYFRFSGQPLLPLSAMLPKGNYVYISTATKVLAPSVRTGYLASSPQMIQRLTQYRSLVDIQGDIIMERALLELIESGDVRRHIRRVLKVYNERLDYISHSIQRELKGKVCYHRPVGGLAIWIEMLHDPTPYLRDRGIDATILSLSSGRFGMRIGYASMSKENVDLLISALSEL